MICNQSRSIFYCSKLLGRFDYYTILSLPATISGMSVFLANDKIARVFARSKLAMVNIKNCLLRLVEYYIVAIYFCSCVYLIRLSKSAFKEAAIRCANYFATLRNFVHWRLWHSVPHSWTHYKRLNRIFSGEFNQQSYCLIWCQYFLLYFSRFSRPLKRSETLLSEPTVPSPVFDALIDPKRKVCSHKSSCDTFNFNVSTIFWGWPQLRQYTIHFWIVFCRNSRHFWKSALV